jgi:Uma2 family endonuclease
MLDSGWEVHTMSVTAQSVSPALPPSDALLDAPIYRLSVAQYHAMGEHGILGEDDPVELLEGLLVRKMTRYRPHTLTTGLVRRALERLLPTGWYVESQEPITTVESEPEPDAMIVRGEPRDLRDRQPGPEEVVLVVEVADTSLATDRGTKKRVYARAGILVYWIANLVEGRFEVYTEPTGPAEQPDYRQRQEYGPDDEIPVVLDGNEVGRLLVRELLP